MFFIRFSILCMCIASFAAAGILNNIRDPGIRAEPVPSDLEQWLPHMLDFMELIDVTKLITVAMDYMSDPEVLNFATFVTSPQFSDLVYEFESMDEFKEAFNFLASKGYDVEIVLDAINSVLNVPPFEKPFMLKANKKGISGLLQDMMAAFPIEDMKKLFENKLETSPEIAKLFETINFKEFVHILKKMSQNPKFKEFKETFESYGFEFEIICAGAKEIFGEHYQGIFCE